MLIIAIPKSASSSLLHTLGKATGLPHKQLMFGDMPIPRESKVIHKYHSDIRILPEKTWQQLSDANGFFKQHGFPSPENLHALGNIRKVVLLRTPEDIISAYWRAEMSHIHAPRKEFSSLETIDKWMHEAKENGLYDDLMFFQNCWIEEADRNPSFVHLIHYNQLMSDPTNTINGILRYFNLSEIPHTISLSRKRYSRGAAYNNAKNRMILFLESMGSCIRRKFSQKRI